MLAVGGAYVAGLAYMNRRKALALVALVGATFAVPVRAIWQAHRYAPTTTSRATCCRCSWWCLACA